MIQLNILDQIEFLIIICFSFLIFSVTLSMNKNTSLSKVLGIAFFIPFSLSVFSALFIEEVSFTYIFWLSEVALSLIFLTLIVFSSKRKSHDFIMYSIFIISAICCIMLYKLNIPPLYALSSRNQVLILVYLIVVNLILLRYKKVSMQQFFLANIFLLMSAVINYFQDQEYIRQISLLFKLAAYYTFYYCFYREIYDKFVNKVKEANKLKKTINRELNREVKKQMLHYEIAKEKLLMKSKTDSLTKAYNKETIINVIDELIKFNEGESFSILMFDIDNFKEINDTYGHITGDICIKNLVNTVRGSIRDVDVLGRYGGDEFILVLPALDLKESRLVGERLRENVSTMSNPKFTISVGVATYPQDGKTVKDLISMADEGLYQSKKSGKNSVSHSLLS